MTFDTTFLSNLDQYTNKIIYAKIIALTLDENPIEQIEGRITQGTINLDGASCVRRTCSLTVIADNFNYSNYLWGLNTKFKLEIGVQNEIDSRYPQIVWFTQGIYFITSFNTARSTNNFTITIQGKDKMSALNGDLGGTLNASIDFGMIEEEDVYGNWIMRKIPIKNIIQNIVHQYGGEPLHNIIINDIPDYGLELLEYRYDTPMYLYRLVDRNMYLNATLDGNLKCVTSDGVETKLSELTVNELEMLTDPFSGTTNPKPVQIDDQWYIIAKIQYGQTAGYRQTPLTYAGDLVANIGESVTSILDKIKNMLGDFEYFFNLDGQFIFQKKQTYIETPYSPIVTVDQTNESYIINQAYAESSYYDFQDGLLITSFNNNPNIANLKNDFSIWGQRVTTTGTQLPIHLRYSIDTKPIEYNSINVDIEGIDKEAIDRYNQINGTNLSGQISQKYLASELDWRELIYQMALDYYKYSHLDDFALKVATANPKFYPSGKTGYEQYYIDLQGFWRQLYNPFLQNNITNAELAIEKLNTQINELNALIQNADRTISKVQIDQWTLELQNAEFLLANTLNELEELKKDIQNYYYEDCYINEKQRFWNKSVYEYPENLNFWFDFLDTEGFLSKLSNRVVGNRPKTINDTNIKSIYFKKTPNVLFVESISDIDNINSAYTYIQIPGTTKMFTISAQGRSAKDTLDDLLYQHTYCAESATINCIPIYHLQPNTRIHIVDNETHLNGDYTINKITMPLTYNGTMSLTVTKTVE